MRISIYICLLSLLIFSCQDKNLEQEAADWMAANSHSISTVEAGNGYEDLKPFGEMIGSSRIVSLGEPTHGNREVFQLKHRMIEFLVEEEGFNIFALECPFAEAYDINRYVLDGIGDPEKALAGIYYWAWDTREVVELLKYLRAYNADPENQTKIRVYGFDVQNPEGAARRMLEYLQKVDPGLREKVYAELAILSMPFSNPELIGNRQWIAEETDSASLRDINLVMEKFDNKKSEYIEKSSEEEWALARQFTRQIQIYIEAGINDGENWAVVRDLGQAQNLDWIMNQEAEDTRMIVWAHNSHVSNSTRWGANHMGYYMKKWYGDEIKIFGFFFNKGGFRAIDEESPSKGMYDFTVGPAVEGSFENLMSQIGFDLAVLDLSRLSESNVVYKWFDQERLTRNSGGGFNNKNAEHFLWPYNLMKAYDALVFLDSTTAVIDINDADYEHMWLITDKKDVPSNTDFEENTLGESPNDWVAWSKFDRLGATMTVSDDNPYKGNYAAIIQREEGLKYGEIAVNLRQYIDAKPYRGKRIKLKVAARAETAEPNFAFLRLSIDPSALDDAHDGLPPLFDSYDTHRVTSSDWKIYEIEADVDERADIIHYGLYLRDFGTAWMDDVVIEIVE